MGEDLLLQRKETLKKLVHDPAYVPMKTKEIAMLLDIPREQRMELQEVLDILVAEGAVGLSKKGKYGKPEIFSVTGLFSGHPKGFGFVTVEGMEQDNQKLNQDIFIPQGKDMGAVTGHKVVVHVTDFGTASHNPEGEIVEIIGHVNDPGTDILSLIRAYGLPEDFPEDVMAQAELVHEQVEPWELEGRLDLRTLPTVTIDGDDAKDLDDAVTLYKEGDRYHLGVHIADVTHYVKEGSPLDREALKRGTSVYLVDRVIPMLPHKLSNGICSLNAGEDRLALSCLMEIDQKGKVLGHQIAETVIRVDRRMSYKVVDAIITHRDPEAMAEYQELVPLFDLLKELSDRIRKGRDMRGAIDFDLPESEIILDERGEPLSIRPYDRNAATKIIEDLMLTANETVAEDFYWQQLPFLYRTHEKPDPEKVKQLSLFLQNLGHFIRTGQGEIHPKEIQKLLDAVEGTDEEPLIRRLALRSMKQAHYTTECLGHFGLSARYYCHFTSPIRRYPDLQIHRIIKEHLKAGLSEHRIAHYDALLPQVAVQTSALERRASEAERETDKLKKCAYMSRFIGHTFQGVVSGITNWGLYVELPNTVEGMVRMTELGDDYYIFDEAHYQLVGERTGKTFKLGQKVTVEVAKVDVQAKNIDFWLARHR